MTAPASLDSQRELIKRTVCKGATDDELELFIAICNRTGLDPFQRQIYAIKRFDPALKTEVMQTQVSIDGFRTLADASGEMGGQDGPYWCGADGLWRDVWLASQAPRAARVVVLRGQARYTGVALYESYCQLKRDGTPTRMWAQMAPEMLAKCAESLALRKAFPRQLSGLYTADEMAQASNSTPERVTSITTDQLSTETAAHPVRVLPPPTPPQRPLEANLGGNAGTSVDPTGSPQDQLGPMRARIAQKLGALNGENKSQALEVADKERVPLPDEVSFTAEHANRWLEIFKEVTA
jgi:phage recombination protein Bet